MSRLFVLFSALALLLCEMPARATDFVQATYCADHLLDHEDQSTGDHLTGTSTPARGAMIRFFPAFGAYFDYYLSWDGSTPGCRLVTIDRDLGPFMIKIVRKAFVNGNWIEVFDDTTSPALYATTVDTNHTPSSGATYDYDVSPGSGVRILAAASWALYRRSGGVSGETFSFVTEASPAGGTAWVPATGYIHINPSTTASEYKFIIAHEFGHALSDAANDWDGLNDDKDAQLNGCNVQTGPDPYDQTKHYINSKEFQSAAAVEGIAHFYSALAFNNDGTGADCWMEKHYDVDWNSNGTVEGGEPSVFPCDEAGVSGVPSPGVDGYDYVGDYCLASGATNNRSTELDWTRHLWNIRTAYGQNLEDIFEVWNAANPDDWNANGNGTGTGYPADRMRGAAFLIGGIGLQSYYDTSASVNGTGR